MNSDKRFTYKQVEKDPKNKHHWSTTPRDILIHNKSSINV